MRYELSPTSILLRGDEAALARIYSVFSYTDKAIEYQISRFKKQCKYRESRGRFFPGYDEWKAKKANELESKKVVFCCDWIEENRVLSAPIGLFEKIRDLVTRLGIEFTGEDHRNFDLEKKRLTGFTPKLRFYQKEAIEAAINAEMKIGMIRLPTGSGKTQCAIEIIRHFGVRSIFLVPSKQILVQRAERFRYAFGRKNVGVFGAGKKNHSYVTVATYQSVFAASAEEFSEYSLVCYDECHHLPAETYFEVSQNRLKNAVYHWSFSADEERLDGGTILVEAAGGPIIYSYDISQAIKDGFLARPTFIVYEVIQTQGHFIEWDNEDLKRRPVGLIQSECYIDPDHHWASKHWVIGNDLLTKFLADLAMGFSDYQKSVLILVDEKEHGEKFMELFKDHKSGFVFGGGKENEEFMEQFNKRKLKILVGTSVIGEGADTVPVDVLINLMGGRRPKQANGRALRNDPDENGVPRKPETLIIDVDFPLNETLHQHCLERVKTHEQCGEVHRSRLSL